MYIPYITNTVLKIEPMSQTQQPNFVPHTILLAGGCHLKKVVLSHYTKDDFEVSQNIVTDTSVKICTHYEQTTNKQTNKILDLSGRYTILCSTRRSCLRIVQPVTFTGFRKIYERG